MIDLERRFHNRHIRRKHLSFEIGRIELILLQISESAFEGVLGHVSRRRDSRLFPLHQILECAFQDSLRTTIRVVIVRLR